VTSPPWGCHRRADSTLPDGFDESRALLRRGSLPEVLLRGGAGPALVAGDSVITHGQLRATVGALAGGLLGRGVHANDRVAIFAERRLEWILGYLAVLRLGAIAVPINPAYTLRELEQILIDAEPSAVICDAARAGLVTQVQPRVPSLAAVIDLEDLPRAPEPGWPDRGPEDPALIMYTSGTTGQPRGVLLDHGNLLSQARGVVEAWRWEPSDRLIHSLPLFHVHGLVMGLTGTLVAGASLELVNWNPAAVVGALGAGGTMFFAVPAMYQRLCAYLELEPADLSSVRLFVSGSAPLPPSLFGRCVELLGQAPLERYGLTEAGIVISNPYDGPRRPGRVGHPLPGVEVRLAENGEVQVRGGQVFSSYWRPRADAAVRVVEGWLGTQDLGEIDESGSLAIHGRLRDLIISGGFNVHPREVEVVLEEHPGVREVAVAGVRSERWGEAVTAYVVAEGTVETTDLMVHCRERLAPYKCPQQIRFVAAIPRNAMGKVMREKLEAAALA